MNCFIKELKIDGEVIKINKAGFINGERAATACLDGPDGWGVSINMKLTEVDSFIASNTKLRGFIQFAKQKLGMDEASKYSRGELKVLRVLNENLTNEELADRLFISIYTVKSHLYSVYKKANVKNRKQLLAYLAKHNFFSSNTQFNQAA